jgi:uroporphyrin-III C-methyltransferase
MTAAGAKKIKEPRITLVGAGPGDPELITMKGVNALKDADVILYDALVNEKILDYASPDVIRVYVGKRAGDHTYSQEAMNQLMVDYALNSGHVVRLNPCTGDPRIIKCGLCPGFTADPCYTQGTKRELLGSDRNNSFRRYF